MFNNKRWTRVIALTLMTVMSVMLLASCKAGQTFADNPGDENNVSVIPKDQSVEVPYTGEPKIIEIETTDPAYAPSNSEGPGSDDDDALGDDGTDDDTNQGGGNDSQSDTDTDNNGGSSGTDMEEIWANDESGTKLRLMTQNIRSGSSSLTGTGDGDNNTIALRRYRFKKLVETYEPDVICTQEVTPLWIEQFETLLGDTYGIQYKYRSDSSKEATPVQYKLSKYELIEANHAWLSKTPDVESPSYGESSIPARITTWCKLKDKSTGVTFTVYSAHFGLGGGDIVIGAGNQLGNYFAEMPKGSYAFALGDFNDAYMSKEYQTYVDWQKIVDLRDICSDMAGYGIGEMGDLRDGSMSEFDESKKDGTGSFIDHIIAKPNGKLAVEYYTVLYDRPSDAANNVPEGYVSDHFAVMCDVRMNTSVSYAEFYGNL